MCRFTNKSGCCLNLSRSSSWWITGGEPVRAVILQILLLYTRIESKVALYRTHTILILTVHFYAELICCGFFKLSNNLFLHTLKLQ